MPESRRRAKIVCTIGPASSSEPVLLAMTKAGMDVARLNFSHGTHDEHAATLRAVRRVSEKSGRELAVLQDLQGPKLRIGRVPGGSFEMRRGEELLLAAGKPPDHPRAVAVSHKELPGELEAGDLLLLDDGLIQLRVTGITGGTIHTEVEQGGTVRSKKGLNIPGRRLGLPALTAKDRRDLRFGIELGVDLVALSFVRDADDVAVIKRVIRTAGADVPVIAKLEKLQAVENLEAILEAADGIMVARGDLGVELPPERVPVLQKGMILAARLAGKPVITATQMLESMVGNTRPTRAEASDVANAIFDGTDAVMLSAETATGDHPVETVAMMARIISSAESSRSYRLAVRHHAETGERPSVADSIGSAAAGAARDLGARVIAVFTSSGSTARLVSKYRPEAPVYAFSPDPEIVRRLRLVWGVYPRRVRRLPSTDAMVEEVVKQLLGEKCVRRGDLIVFTAGTPVGRPGSTNFLKIHRVE
jgi:pyruvate kinase